jgi:hypothetical protein
MEIPTIGQFFHYFGNVREPTMRVARCIPPDKIDWTYVLAFHADAPLYIPGAKTRIPAELVTCEHICDST